MIVEAFESKSEQVHHLDVSAVISNKYNSGCIKVELYVVPNICSPIANQVLELAQAAYDHLIELEIILMAVPRWKLMF